MNGPDFIEFEQRAKFDIDALARTIFKSGLGGKAKVEFLDREWENSKTEWLVFFGFEHKKYFVNEVAVSLRRIEYPEMFARKEVPVPDVHHPREDLARFPLSDLFKTHPKFYRRLRDAVYAKHKAKDGSYICARSEWRSRNRFDFEIDHKIPFAKGAQTTLDNLQLLRRIENRRKGTTT